MDQKISALVKENNKLKDELRNSVNKNIEETKPNIDVLKSENKLKELEEKCEKSNERILELEEKLKEAFNYQCKFELQSVELQNLKLKFENLQSEQCIYEENKQFSSRALKLVELEKELKQARDINASLRESVKGKLLLEEQMAHLETR